MTSLPSISSSVLKTLPPDELRALAREIEELEARQRQNQIVLYKPYKKQLEFHKAGKTCDERLLMAANQVGKTYAAGCEVSYHLTGEYPDWWEGRTYDRPVRGWAGGVTQEATRDASQRILIGEPAEPSQWGTGTIPGRKIVKMTNARGVPNCINSVVFKNYEQGRPKWQAETLDFVWFDEEPPMELYTEGNTRTAVTNGFTMITFTPLLGMSEVVRQFLSNENVKQLQDAA